MDIVRPCLEYCSHVLKGINAPQLTSQLPFLKVVLWCCLCLHNAWRSWFIMCLVLKISEAILGSSFLRMNFVSKLVTLVSISKVLTSFLTQAFCGIIYLLHFFLSSYNLSSFKRWVYQHLRGIYWIYNFLSTLNLTIFEC